MLTFHALYVMLTIEITAPRVPPSGVIFRYVFNVRHY